MSGDVAPHESIRAVLLFLKVVVGTTAVVIAFVLWQSYEGRVDLVQAQRNGCERTKLDRGAEVRGWLASQLALDALSRADAPAGHRLPDGLASAVRTSVEILGSTVADLESRLGPRLRCDVVFPDASLLP